MNIIFSSHAEEKITLLNSRNFPISKEQVLDCMNKPDKIVEGYKGRKVAQKQIDENHVLRVIFIELEGSKRVITFYPGKVSRYENKLQ